MPDTAPEPATQLHLDKDGNITSLAPPLPEVPELIAPDLTELITATDPEPPAEVPDTGDDE